MIDIADMKNASRNLDIIYKTEILPILTEVRKVWDKLTMQYLDENNKRIAVRHGFNFLPSEKWAKPLQNLVGFSRARVYVAERTTAPVVKPHWTIRDRWEAVPQTLVEFTGHNNCYGFWDGTLWSVIEGNSWANGNSVNDENYNKIYQFLHTIIDRFAKIREDYKLFTELLPAIVQDMTVRFDGLMEMDEKDTAEFNALFGVKPAKKHLKIVVSVEEERG